ncbi:hypothetical protein ATL17_0281 [Maritalea mobilis]|uniref:Uncharacterized protein n=2 Tax=Maritalea mobilis TaxID=483324 RepID=A0A4V3DBF0_9HYPH|nr:hypothetical protein ATL17_0281 [Maritalea mobilis]
MKRNFDFYNFLNKYGLLAIAIFIAFLVVLHAGIREGVPPFGARVGTIETFSSVATLIVGLYAIVLLNRRTQALENTLGHQERSELDARFKDGVELLFKDERSSLAGALVLERLAIVDKEKFLDPVIEVLVSALQNSPNDQISVWRSAKSRLAEISDLNKSSFDYTSYLNFPIQPPKHQNPTQTEIENETTDLKNIIQSIEANEHTRFAIAQILGKLRYIKKYEIGKIDKKSYLNVRDIYRDKITGRYKDRIGNIPAILVQGSTINLTCLDLGLLKFYLDCHRIIFENVDLDHVDMGGSKPRYLTCNNSSFFGGFISFSDGCNIEFNECLVGELSFNFFGWSAFKGQDVRMHKCTVSQIHYHHMPNPKSFFIHLHGCTVVDLDLVIDSNQDAFKFTECFKLEKFDSRFETNYLGYPVPKNLSK